MALTDRFHSVISNQIRSPATVKLCSPATAAAPLPSPWRLLRPAGDLYRGLVPALLTSCPSASLFIALSYLVKRLLLAVPLLAASGPVATSLVSGAICNALLSLYRSGPPPRRSSGRATNVIGSLPPENLTNHNKLTCPDTN